MREINHVCARYANAFWALGAVRFAPREAAITERYDKRMDDANVLSCGSQT